MPLSELHQKIRAEAAVQNEAKRTRNRPFGHDGRVGGVPARVSAVKPRVVPDAPTTTELRECTLAALARVIQADWQDRVYFGAVPYIQALGELHVVALRGEHYGADRADSVVRYFLANAQTWRGETARRVKAELKRRLAA